MRTYRVDPDPDSPQVTAPPEVSPSYRAGWQAARHYFGRTVSDGTEHYAECNCVANPSNVCTCKPDGWFPEDDETFTPRVWRDGQRLFVEQRYGGCYDVIEVANVGADVVEEVSEVPPTAVELT